LRRPGYHLPAHKPAVGLTSYLAFNPSSTGPAAAMAGDPLSSAVRRCPFLALVGAREGEAYARNLAANPFARASAGPVLLEEDGMSSFAATLRVFHGPGGVVPLRRFHEGATSGDAVTATPSRSCPFHAAATQVTAATAQSAASGSATDSSSSSRSSPSVPAQAATKCPYIATLLPPAPPALARAPFASMSLSGFGFTVSSPCRGFCALSVSSSPLPSCT
jgi:hypothetical protein